MKQIEKRISSREVANMMEVEHKHLLRKIDRINEDFTKSKIGFSKYWVESSYKDSTGGHGSNAYNDKSLRGRVYSDIHREVKRQFGVDTYKAIKRNQCDLAISIISKYQVPLSLAEDIRNSNAQECFA